MAKIHNPNDKVLIHTGKGGVFETTWEEYQNSLHGAEGVRAAGDEIEPNKEFDIAYGDFYKRISILSSNIRYDRSDSTDYTQDISKLLSELRKYIKENPHDAKTKNLLDELKKTAKNL